MRKDLSIKDLGLIEFEKALLLQEKAFDKLLHKKVQSRQNGNCDNNNAKELFFLCEHPSVFTLGRSGSKNNLLIPDSMMKALGTELLRVNRGGDITYHGPGQIVVYPIIDLDNYGLTIKKYIYLLEEVVIETLKEYELNAFRHLNSTGVWVNSFGYNTPMKICAIGVKASRSVTMHGFALNVNTDLTFFQYINPCGLINKGVISMKIALARMLDIGEVKTKLGRHIKSAFKKYSKQ